MIKSEKFDVSQNPIVNKFGVKHWYNEFKQLHRIDGAAIEWPDGDKFWYLNGLRFTESEFKNNVKLILEQKPMIHLANDIEKELWLSVVKSGSIEFADKAVQEYRLRISKEQPKKEDEIKVGDLVRVISPAKFAWDDSRDNVLIGGTDVGNIKKVSFIEKACGSSYKGVVYHLERSWSYRRDQIELVKKEEEQEEINILELSEKGYYVYKYGSCWMAAARLYNNKDSETINKAMSNLEAWQQCKKHYESHITNR